MNNRELATEIIFGNQSMNEDTTYMRGSCSNLCQKNHSNYNDIQEDNDYDYAVNGANEDNSKPDLEYVKELIGNKISIMTSQEGSERRAPDRAAVRNAVYCEAVARLAEDIEYMKTSGTTQQDEPGDDKVEDTVDEYDPSVNGVNDDNTDPDLEAAKRLAGNTGVNIMTDESGSAKANAFREAAAKLIEAADYMKTSGTTQQDEPGDDKVEDTVDEYDPSVNGANASNSKPDLEAIRDLIDQKAIDIMTANQGEIIVK